MKKRFLALCFLLMITLTACGNSSSDIAMEYNEITLSNEVYSYYYSAAYNYALLEVSDGEDVFTATINGMTGEEYIYEQTMDYCLEYLWSKNYFVENDMEFSTEDLAYIEYITDSQWSYFEESFTDGGVSYESFDDAYSAQNLRVSNIFITLYDEGGLYEVDSQEVYDYIIEYKYGYEFLYAPNIYIDENEDNYGEELSEEDSLALFEKLEEYAQRVDDGEILSDIADEYVAELGIDATLYYEYIISIDSDSYPENFLETIESMDESGTTVFYSEDTIILLNKYDIEEVAEIIINDESNYLSMLYEYKFDDLENFINEGKSVVEENLIVYDEVIEEIGFVNLFDY